MCLNVASRFSLRHVVEAVVVEDFRHIEFKLVGLKACHLNVGPGSAKTWGFLIDKTTPQLTRRPMHGWVGFLVKEALWKVETLLVKE